MMSSGAVMANRDQVLVDEHMGNHRFARESAKDGKLSLKWSSTLRRLSLAVCLGATSLLGACATGANPGAMTAAVSEATLLPQQSQLHQAVTVGAVTGGEETNPLWKSQVSNSDFAEALRRSLAVHTILASDSGGYRLEAQLVGLDQPFGGFDMEVKATVLYRLAALRTGQLVFERRISNAYTANFSSSFYGVTRLRLANEGAIRENIQSLIQALVEEERNSPGSFNPPLAELLPQIRRLAPV